ncbi:hypothetical protein JXR93_02415 [bacterium]|nr:hypothetical protein [bacterium]
MRFIYLIIILFTFFQQYIFANSDNGNDLSFSVHLGVSKGSGFGLTYNIFDNIDITINTVPIFEFGDNKNEYLIVGASIDYYFSQKNYGFHFTLPTIVYVHKDSLVILGTGVGYKQSLDEKTYLSYNIDACVLIEQYDSEYTYFPFISPGVTFGYVF